MDITVTAGDSITIMAVATDNLEQTTTAEAVVPVTFASPTVSITSPAEGSTFREGDIVTLTAAATGDVSTVVFVFDGASLPALT